MLSSTYSVSSTHVLAEACSKYAARVGESMTLRLAAVQMLKAVVLEEAVVSPFARTQRVREMIDRDDHLVEERDKVDEVRIAALEVLDWVGHVQLVVRTVEVHADPARREEDL